MAKWIDDQRQNIEVMALAGGLAVLAGLVVLVRDLVRILPNRDVPVPVELAKVPHDLLLDGTTTAQATEAVIRVSDLNPVPYAVVLAAALLPTITLMLVAVCFTVLGRSFRSGDFFARRSVRTMNVTALTLVLGSVAIPTLQGLAADSALATVDIEFGPTLEIDWVLFMAGLLLGTVWHAFQRGARLQQDTEGLV
ncbi:hypothetical protein [Promicromonospora umidemergens]|uniref:DUF2975 family protein n=1 Tax=Promicromonospora umidemergens TaxID=629679 RepID=A0ABP8WF31_9MICO|nr:hypothetical protein [Promicromonospora umidemergens]